METDKKLMREEITIEGRIEIINGQKTIEQWVLNIEQFLVSKKICILQYWIYLIAFARLRYIVNFFYFFVYLLLQIFRLIYHNFVK